MADLSHDFTPAPSISGGEASLQTSEVLFSRTDDRGVIKCGNVNFCRISGYDWSELQNAPHKIVRHPDMPKGVFELYWSQLKAGKPVGAYVKNRTKTGRYYWVFALAMPIDDGFISIRIKPTGGMLAMIAEMYADLARREQADGLTPSESAAEFCKALAQKGYPTYDVFQSVALASEQKARSQQLGRPLTPLQTRFMEMSRAIYQVQTETTDLTEAFQSIRTVPMNMRIIASRLQTAGGPISAISVNYSQMLEDMSTWVNTFVDGDDCVFARIRNAILRSQFLGFISGLENDTITALTAQGAATPGVLDPKAEVAIIETCIKKNIAETAEALGRVEHEARRFGRSVLDMKRYVTGLSSTRMMCKIESASLSENGADLSGVVDQLDAGQNEIEVRLAHVVELNAVIQSNVSMLRSLL
ncbi:PAS domain-containing protein [Primorskyibacter sp. 2E107]|uniref:PAS domain-containing protein n=1 Tax=Primorskyibacter sp. 2E107 TaxID=3403458 RepID=UPI003AF6859B